MAFKLVDDRSVARELLSTSLMGENLRRKTKPEGHRRQYLGWLGCQRVCILLLRNYADDGYADTTSAIYNLKGF
jgi:hypothetical protein